MAGTWLLLLMAATVALGMPHHHHHRDHHHHHDLEENVYDQRQNGSDNVRVHLDGVVVIHAPADSLAALVSSTDTSDFEQQLAELLGSLGEESSTSTSTSTTTGQPVEAAPTAAAQVSGVGSSQQKPQEDEVATPDKPQNNEGTSSEKPQNDKRDPSDEPQKDKEDPKEKPEKDKGGSSEKPEKDKPAKKDRQRIRLSSLLIPFLRRLE